jgi:putative ABC transport system substrate-binding protein
MSQGRRRQVLIASGALIVTRFTDGAQPAPRVPLIAYMADRLGPMEFDQAFLRRPREFGCIDGQNIRIDYRWGDGTEARLQALIADALRLNPDIVVTGGAPGVRPAKMATATSPIVGSRV